MAKQIPESFHQNNDRRLELSNKMYMTMVGLTSEERVELESLEKQVHDDLNKLWPFPNQSMEDLQRVADEESKKTDMVPRRKLR